MNSKVTYRQQFTRCGKQRCRKCREGAGHGPYWYAYWSEKGRTVSKYIGSRLPEHVEVARQTAGETESKAISDVAVHNPPAPTLRIYVLGQFRIDRKSEGEWRAIDSRTWHRRRARALLGCLISSPGRRLGREQVMELLWPDLDIDIAANRLNGAVHELRQILEPEIARPAASRMLRLERDILELADSTQVWVDAEEFERLLKDARTATDPQQTERLLEEAASLYRGSYLLEELYSEWAAPRRDALQRAWVSLLLDLANLRAEQGTFVSAIEALDRLRTAEPTNETALQRLMILLTQLDRRGEALQVYRQHATMLQRDYESEPLPETVELYEALRRGHIPNVYTIRTQAGVAKEKDVNPPLTPQTEQQDPPLQEVSFIRPAFQLGRHNQSRLIGRSRETDMLHQALLAIEDVTAKGTHSTTDGESNGNIHRTLPTVSTSSRARRPHFLLLKGDSGIGKTRLAEELSLEAYTRGWAVAWSRSYEQEGTIPYRPWTELLRTLLHGTSTFAEILSMTIPTDGASVAHIAPTSPFKLERLSALLPELALHTTPVPMRSGPPVPHEQERLHLWEATLGLLGALSKMHPLLLVLDDLQWTDDSSIELLTYLTHHLQDQRVLLAGTCRDGELPPQHKLRTLITDLRREQAITTISVQPLTHTQIGTLVSHLPKNIVQSIQMQAAGNPFFAEELARYVGASYSDEDPLAPIAFNEQSDIPPHMRSGLPHQKVDRDPSHSSRSLPEAIAAVLERRLSRLSNGCQILLGKAAVLGGSFELSQLVPMTNEQDEDTILDLLEEALHAGLLTEEGTGAHITYHFWHPLIISHLYGRLSAARRAQLHRRAAETIKAAYPSSQQEKVAASIVYHLSRGGGDPSTVAYYAEMAGNQAYSLAAYSEAQQYYLQVLQSLVSNEPHIQEASDVHTQIQKITPKAITQLPFTDPLHICRLLERTAECSMVLGNYEDARHLYECVLVLRTSEDFQRKQFAFTTSSEEMQQQEAQIQALLWREIGNTWAGTSEYARVYECYERGKEVMSRAGVTSGAAWACLRLQYGEMLRLEGNYQEARQALQEALEMLERVVQQSVAPQQEANSIQLVRKQEALAPAESTPLPAPKELQTRTERALIGDPLEIGNAHERLGIVAASVGQLSDALKHLHIALTIYEQSELVSEMARVCSNLGAVYILRGEHESAHKYMHHSLGLAERAGDLPNMSFVMVNLGDMAHRSGDLLESEGWYKQSLALSERINDRERISWCSVELAAVQQDLGNLSEARASLQRAIMTGRAIKSSRCVHYALVKLGDLRIVEAIINRNALLNDSANSLSQETYHRLLMPAKLTLQRAISLEGLEIEHIIEGKHLLATVYFLLRDLGTAQHMALQTLKEAQEQEAISIIGRAYRLLGRILAEQQDYEQSNYYFEQAMQVFREPALRLDYARTLHGYGLALIHCSRLSTDKVSDILEIQAKDQQKREQIYQRGLNYLHEARAIFVACHAAIDLSWIEQALSKVEAQKIGK